MKRAAWFLLCFGLVPAVAFAAEEAPVEPEDESPEEEKKEQE